MLNSSCSPGDRKMQERVGLEQQGWALDSKNVRFEKSSSPVNLTACQDDPDLDLKGFGFWGIQILFGSSVVGIGSVLFTLFMMFVFLSNRSTNLKRGNFFSWAANTGKTTYLKKKDVQPSYMRQPAPWQDHQLSWHVHVEETLGRWPRWDQVYHLVRSKQSLYSTSWAFIELGMTRSAALTSRSHLPVWWSQRIDSK